MIGKRNYIVNANIDWKHLSNKPNAIHILEQNLDKVDWEYLYIIFTFACNTFYYYKKYCYKLNEK
jgi:hypothetical protein